MMFPVIPVPTTARATAGIAHLAASPSLVASFPSGAPSGKQASGGGAPGPAGESPSGTSSQARCAAGSLPSRTLSGSLPRTRSGEAAHG